MRGALGCHARAVVADPQPGTAAVGGHGDARRARAVAQRVVEQDVDDLPRRLRRNLRGDGPGVAPERAAHLFARRASSGDDGRGGVGLAVARDLVRGEGGDLRLVGARPACFEAEVPGGGG